MKTLHLLLGIILLTAFTAEGQNLKKAFKYLNNKEYDRAKVVFDDAAKQAQLASPAYYGLARIYQAPDYRAHDYYRAFDAIIQAEERWPYVDATVIKKLNDYFQGKSDIDKLKSKIDRALYDEVKSKNELSATERFLKEAKKSAFYHDAKAFYASQRYNETNHYNTVKAYEDYISEFPLAPETELARKKIYLLSYGQALKADDLDTYKAFIAKYPEAPQVPEVKQKILEKEYEMVLLINTDDAYDRFILMYPNTPQAAKLRKKQMQLNYLRAKQLNSVSVYNAFLQKFPASPYVEEITELRDSLAFEQARAINTREAYKEFVNSYPNAKQVPEVLRLQKDLNYSKEELRHIKKRQFFASRKIRRVEYFRMKNNDTIHKKLWKTIDYDRYGNPVEEHINTVTGVKEVINRSYSNDGQLLLKEEKTVDGAPRYLIHHYYNEAGLLDSSRIICYQNCENGLAKGNYRMVYSFNADRLPLKKTIYNEKGELIEERQYMANNQKLIAQELVTKNSADGVSKLKINYQYNFYEQLIQKSTFSGENEIEAVETYFYDKQGRVTKSSSYNALGKERKENKYNAQGLLVETDMEYPDKSLDNHRVFLRYYFFK